MSGGKKQQKNRRDAIKYWRFHVLPPERLPRDSLPRQSPWSGACCRGAWFTGYSSLIFAKEVVATSEQFFYDVSKDDQKFLINTQLRTGMAPMSVVLNWSAKLNQ
jgi:hypothetical protein